MKSRYARKLAKYAKIVEGNEELIELLLIKIL